jgi:endonuclease I
MNTEHTWPQADFDKREPMRSDLHHLYPTETESNGTRGSKAFAELGDDEGQAVGVLGARTTEKHFEPPADHKGNVARALFYFAVQHRRDIPVEVEQVLRSWHEQDPVDQAERLRNDVIYRYQLSRNFFVDRPELVRSITDF